MMETDDALKFIQSNSFCLWMGSGVARYLSAPGGHPTPLWGELVALLEKRHNIVSGGGSLPQRMEILRRVLGHQRFQKEIRELVLIRLAKSLIAMGAAGPEIPLEVANLATFAQNAEAIVSFNVETITSTLASSGSYELKSFEPPAREATGLLSKRASFFKDPVYKYLFHPHGAIDMQGLCVLAESDYQSIDNTLTSALAIHLCYQKNLVIIGMSLDDMYLLKQLAKERMKIRTILWFADDEAISHSHKWITSCRISVVRIFDWLSFWQRVAEKLPQPSKLRLHLRWLNTLRYCFEMVAGKNRVAQELARKGGDNIDQFFINRGEFSEEPLEEEMILTAAMRDRVIAQQLIAISKLVKT